MAQVTAAPVCVTIGDQEFLMSPLTDRDNDELTNWLRESIIDMAQKSVMGVESEEVRREVLGAAIVQARKAAFGEPTGGHYFKDTVGLVRVIYQGVKRNHKKLTFQQFLALCRKHLKERTLTQQYLMLKWRDANIPEKHLEGGGAETNGRDASADQGGDLRDDSEGIQVHAEPDREDDPVPAAGADE